MCALTVMCVCVVFDLYCVVVEAVCVSVCVCVCVCVCARVCGVCDVTKMATWRPRGRWRRQQFRGDSRRSCAFSADGRSCTRTRHTQSQRYSSPSATGAAFVVGPTPIPSRPAILCLVGPPFVRTTLPPHPLGSLELAVRPVYPYSL